MKALAAGISIALAMLGAGAGGGAQAAVLVFDMGRADSAVWPGATPITPATIAKGQTSAGWAHSKGLTAHRKAWTSPVENKSRGTQEPPPIWTNPLTEDAVIGQEANAFSFPAPSGKWKVYVRCGVSAGNRAQYWDFDVRAAEETWRCRFAGPYQFFGHTFAVDSNGTITIEVIPRSKWCIAGVVAWQAREGSQAQEIIRRIEQWAPDDELAKWKEDPRPPAGPEPPLTDADRARGFYVWHRHWAQVVYPWTNPTPEEMNPTLRLFAAPGEYEPLTVTVRPLRDIRRFEVRTQPLGPIAPSDIEVRKVRYMAARPNYRVRYQYRIVPDVLERWQAGPLPAGENARFWLTLHVPPRARPGLYRGSIGLIGDGKAVSVPVLLRVLDVRLQEDPEHTYAIYYRHPLDRAFSAPDEPSREYWRRKAELEHADMAAHGTRNVVLSCWFPAAGEDGKFNTRDAFDRLQAKLELAKKYGFRGPYVMAFNTGGVYRKYMKQSYGSHLRSVEMPPREFFAELTEMVRTIEAERKRRGWPDFVYYPIDEPGTSEKAVQFMVGVLKAVRAAGVKTYVTADPTNAAFEPMRPYVDVWCTQPFLPRRESIVKDMQARGVQYWCYPNHVNGENDHTPVAGARMTYGFGFWRSGFLRLIPWIYQANIGDPFNYLDGSAMDFFNRTEPDGRPIPVAMWEAYREGYDDYRYVYSLQQAIERAKRSRSRAARKEAAVAEKTLQFVWKKIPVLAKYKYEGFWSPEEMDVHRWLIARRLERLTKLMR